MADRISPEKRSGNMAAIKSKNTKPEIYIRRLLFIEGYRYRNNTNKVCGHPDIWLRKYNTAIFINGCFWHRHKNCKLAYTPKTRVEFWSDKFEKNIRRDDLIKNELQNEGIKQLVIWECTIRKMKNNKEYESIMMRKIISFFGADNKYIEL